MKDQIKEIKKIFEKLKELVSGDDKSALLEKMEELEENWKNFGEKLNEEIDLWEKENDDVYEMKKDKIKNFRKIAEEFKN